MRQKFTVVNGQIFVKILLVTLASCVTVGPLAATVACDTIGFLNRIDGHLEPSAQSLPKFQYHLNAVPIYSDFGTYIPKTFGLKNEVTA